jgi:Family of unknown function (DUF6526)
MKQQSYKDHARYVPLFHFITYTAVIAIFIGSIVYLFKSPRENILLASLLVVIAFVLGSLTWYSRAFALRAQDRAIRAEENFRHFILTGKPFDKRLRMRQIIALRFVSDEELPGLAQRAADENLNSDAIKKAIKSWKADHHRA